ncbi:hypothetical protein BC936DRAFT_137322 [Jimgerdemannia flammicorona]|uniref:Glutamate--tRNA ligase, mitochondrial n=1 Tax=Jimgerdemannia flammicorona TaxID=994334 RepID=A0A433CXP5_9FUNG|nr:hypothetical protein BC936DRAFT_137322 [Jimgerdemannia flammicorona]
MVTSSHERAATRSTPHIYSSIFARHHHPHAHIDPTGPVRVRFAPSPTGNLHLGGLRTALFNYLLAKKAGGTFILRIEDTDRTRFVEGATEKLISALSWAGLDFQEGPGKDGGHPPYVQSQRIETYSQHAHHLLESGSAYRCFCTPERLQHVRDAAREAGRDSSYDRRCLLLSRQEVEENLSQGMPFTVRLLTPDGVTHVDDLVYGHVEFSNAVLDDTILIKSDGYPTYHMANVVDDHLMGITHVLRGEEWLSSTPRHILLYRAFDWTPPSFVHLPLLLNADRSKLSKRSGDVHVEDYVRRGYLPEALVNFVALLGWSPREDGKEVMRMEELVEEVVFIIYTYLWVLALRS